MAYTSALGPISVAVYAALNVPALTTTLSCGVYDDVPRGAAFPYVRIAGETEVRLDTMGQAGKSCTLQVHIFSQHQGDQEAQAIASQVIALLHYQSLTVSGYELIAVQHDQTLNAGDETVNGLATRHYVVLFRIEVMQTS